MHAADMTDLGHSPLTSILLLLSFFLSAPWCSPSLSVPVPARPALLPSVAGGHSGGLRGVDRACTQTRHSDRHTGTEEAGQTEGKRGTREREEHRKHRIE